MNAPRTASWLLPAAAAILLFLPILGAGFVHDDLPLLRDNPNLRNWSGVARGFAEPFWHVVDDPRVHVGGFYRPLGIAAFVGLTQLGGGSPFAFHLASLLLHGLAAALVARVGLRLGWRPLAAGLAGLIFALHGMHVEPVAWASSLTYLLATVLALAGLLAQLGGRRWLAAAALAGAMLSQETAIGVFLLALAYEGFRRDLAGARGRRVATLAAAALPVYLLRALAFDDAAAGLLSRPITELALPAIERWGIAFSVLFQELRFLVWPWPHAPFRPLPSPERVALADAQRWLPALGGLLALLGAAAWWLRKAARWPRGAAAPPLLLPVGLAFGALLPLLQISNLGQYPFEERFLYLPSAGFALGAGWLLARRTAGTLAALPWLAFHGWSARTTEPHWRDERALFDWGRQAAPGAMLPFNEFGRLLLAEAGALRPDDPRRLDLAEEALAVFQEGLKIKPDEWVVTSIDRLQGNLGLATSLYYQGNLVLAQDAYRRILQRWPDSFQARHGLGVCLAEEGLRELAQPDGDAEAGRRLLEEALVEQIAACEAAPEWAPALHAKGLTLARLGRLEEALPALERAAARDPAGRAFAVDLAQTLIQSGSLLLERGAELAAQDPGAAREPLLAALERFRAGAEADPSRPEAYVGEAAVFELLGRGEEALASAQRAFAVAPHDFAAAQTLFRIQYAAGRLAPAAETLEVWLRAAPRDDPARAAVAQTLSELRAAAAAQPREGG